MCPASDRSFFFCSAKANSRSAADTWHLHEIWCLALVPRTPHHNLTLYAICMPFVCPLLFQTGSTLGLQFGATKWNEFPDKSCTFIAWSTKTPAQVTGDFTIHATNCNIHIHHNVQQFIEVLWDSNVAVPHRHDCFNGSNEHTPLACDMLMCDSNGSWSIWPVNTLKTANSKNAICGRSGLCGCAAPTSLLHALFVAMAEVCFIERFLIQYVVAKKGD